MTAVNNVQATCLESFVLFIAMELNQNYVFQILIKNLKYCVY